MIRACSSSALSVLAQPLRVRLDISRNKGGGWGLAREVGIAVENGWDETADGMVGIGLGWGQARLGLVLVSCGPASASGLRLGL